MNERFEVFVCNTASEYQRKVAEIQTNGDTISMVQFQAECWIITAMIRAKETRGRRLTDEEINAAFSGKPS